MEHNPILKNPLSLDSEIPLYSQLMGIIKRSITSGALKVGDLLPSEAALLPRLRHQPQHRAPGHRCARRRGLCRAQARQGHVCH